MPTPPKPPKRGRRALPRSERKGRLIQTRVAENLDDALHQEAKKKRVTVSQLIRNVLEDTFHLVDNVVGGVANFTEIVTRDAKRIAASAQGRSLETGNPEPPAVASAPITAVATVTPASPPAASSSLEAVAAWQEVVLNRDTHCSACGLLMKKGSQGFLGLQDDAGAPKLWLCVICRGAL